MSDQPSHRYQVSCHWQGSTAAGYESYDRAHRGMAPPALSSFELSADPAFRGDPQRCNPEQLLVLAAASCQLLSFLAVAARARIDVRRYADEAEGVMPASARPVRLTAIRQSGVSPLPRAADRLLATRGATLYPGAALAKFAGSAPARMLASGVRQVDVPGDRAAELFALNLAVWRSDPAVEEAPDELDRLVDHLEGLRKTGVDEQVRWHLRQLALENDQPTRGGPAYG